MRQWTGGEEVWAFGFRGSGAVRAFVSEAEGLPAGGELRYLRREGGDARVVGGQGCWIWIAGRHHGGSGEDQLKEP